MHSHRGRSFACACRKGESIGKEKGTASTAPRHSVTRSHLTADALSPSIASWNNNICLLLPLLLCSSSTGAPFAACVVTRQCTKGLGLPTMVSCLSPSHAGIRALSCCGAVLMTPWREIQRERKLPYMHNTCNCVGLSRRLTVQRVPLPHMKSLARSPARARALPLSRSLSDQEGSVWSRRTSPCHCPLSTGPESG